MSAYYNEWDPFAAQWLRNLIAAGHIAPGDVDERSILEVSPDDLKDYTQCHWFAGIGGWSYALRLAGVPDDFPCWSGSCPCQPFSSASNSRNTRRNDDRNLWPVWRSLIAECSPHLVIGEQTSQAGDWFDVVCDDMENLDYSIGAAILPAASVGFDHARARLYFACHANREGKPIRTFDAEAPRLQRARGQSEVVEDENGLPHRMARMRAYGNAICAPLAATFIEAVMS